MPTLPNQDPQARRDWTNVNITGEEDHQDYLAALRFRILVADLQIQDYGAVGVAINNRYVGQLTPKMSERYRAGFAGKQRLTKRQ